MCNSSETYDKGCLFGCVKYYYLEHIIRCCLGHSNVVVGLMQPSRFYLYVSYFHCLYAILTLIVFIQSALDELGTNLYQ